MTFVKNYLLLLLLVCTVKVLGATNVLDAVNVLRREPVKLYSYQEYPPYRLPGASDLTRELVALINQQLGAGLQFKLQNIDRPELNKLLASGASALVIWTNPYWFQSIRADLLYSDAYFWNSNNFFSFNAKAVSQLNSINDLRGKKLLCVAGHFYKGIDDLVAAGSLQRIDVADFAEMIRRLRRGDADLAIVNRTVLSYYQLHHPRSKRLYVAKVVQDAYLFHILLTSDQQALLPLINKALDKLKASREWKTLGKKYNVARQADMLDFDLNELMEFDQAIPEH